MCAHKTKTCTHSTWLISKTCACASKHGHLDLCLVRTFFSTKIVLIVHYYVMSLSLNFHKDPSFCCRDICKIMLNMHAKGINAHEHVSMRVFACFCFMCAHICAHIFDKIILGAHFSVMSLSFKYKDPSFGGLSYIHLAVQPGLAG